MYIIGPVRTAHFGRCRSFPNRFRIRRKAAADLGGGYFFRSRPNLIAAITSISNAMVSAVLMRSPPLRENNRTVLTGKPHHTRFALLCQFSLPPAGAAFVMCAPHPLFYTERVGSPVEPAGGLIFRRSPLGGAFGDGTRCSRTRPRRRSCRRGRTRRGSGLGCNCRRRAAQRPRRCSSSIRRRRCSRCLRPPTSTMRTRSRKRSGFILKRNYLRLCNK